MDIARPEAATNATLGARLRRLRKCLGYERVTTWATFTKLSPNTILKIERGEMKVIKPWILGRILSVLRGRIRDIFPAARGDIYDYLIPPKTFGNRLRNLRLRRGMQQKVLAKALGVARFTLQRYESDQSKPNREIMRRIDLQWG